MNNIEKWTHHKVKLEILTPVIINTGECYEYGELQILNNKLYKISMNNLIKIMDENTRNKYIDFITKGISSRDVKYHEQAKQLAEKTIFDNRNKLSLIITRPMGMLESSADWIKKRPFQIIEKSCVKKINEKPYIPGSSIKGAIRTAIIQSILNLQNINENEYVNYDRHRYNKTRNFESKILKAGDKVKDDPFKYIKISDFEFDDNMINSYVGKILVSTKRDPLPVYTTMTDSYSISSKKITLTGELSISSKISNVRELSKLNNFSFLIDSLNDFYIDNFNNKAQKLPNKAKNYMIDLLTKNISNNKGLMKIGRFSGIENITYNIKQNQTINRKIYNDDINIEGGTSYPLIDNMFMPGYCLLSEVVDEINS